MPLFAKHLEARELSKSVISRVIIRVTPVRVLKTLLTVEDINPA